LDGFRVESEHVRKAGCDWKIFLEIYFDDYHVEPFHPGLSSMADCGALEWIWAPRAQAQIVGASAMRGGGSSSYKKFFEASANAFGPSPVAAVWAAVYPSSMVEWLGGCLALSCVEPAGAGECVNKVVFAYPEGVAEKWPDLVAAHQAAYWETACEDDAIASRIQAGRECLSRRGDHEAGPAHPHLEAGIVKFHEWLSLALASSISTHVVGGTIAGFAF
jgi:choline monooxygenase